MKNIAAFVKDLSVSQSSFYLINTFNDYMDDTDISTCVFFERPSIPPIRTQFACKSVSFLSSYHGAVISTTIEGADKVLKSGNASSKFLYLWDIEWLDTPMYFETAIRILRDDRLKIIARSKSHAEIIETFCNKKPIGVISDWNATQLLEIIDKED